MQETNMGKRTVLDDRIFPKQNTNARSQGNDSLPFDYQKAFLRHCKHN